MSNVFLILQNKFLSDHFTRVFGFLSVLQSIRWINTQFFNEALKDQWGVLYLTADWSELAPLPLNLDYSWLQNASRPVFIAHALGEAEHFNHYSITAQLRALKADLRFLEVDLWLDKSERLKCQDDPDLPMAPVEGECSLKSAVHTAAVQGAWLLIDIKTAFKLTVDEIVQQFFTDLNTARLIFQLYRPADIHLFSLWDHIIHLLGPIVVVRQARCLLQHFASQLGRLGNNATTYLMHRGKALFDTSGDQELARFVHPVHDYTALQDAKRQGVYCYYFLTLTNPR
jgi:hypothetical protein